MQYIILYLLLALLFFINIKFDKSQDIREINGRLNGVRGIFAILIIFTHCTLAFEHLPIILLPLRKISTFGVEYFFVMSGYGLAYSFNNKQGYLNNFFEKKMLKLITATIIVQIISCFVTIFFLKNNYNVIKGINWYVYAQLVGYIIFYISYKNNSTKKNRVITLFLLTLLLCTAILTLQKIGIDLGRNYYISELAFPLGAIVYECIDYIEVVIKKRFVMLNIIMLFLLVATFGIASIVKEKTMLDLIFHNLMFVPFYYFLIVLCGYCKVGNKILSYLNSISLELYLYQFIILAIFKKLYYKFNVDFNVIYFIAVLACDILVSALVHFLSAKISIKKLITKSN